MSQPLTTLGMRHVALFIEKFDQCEHFYIKLLGLNVDWRPDPDNLYLSSGYDNIALHRAPPGFAPGPHQHLDHIGFMVKTPEDVDAWFEHLRAEGVTIKAGPRQHRDGTRSFYCADPDGNTIQFIHCPGIKA